MLILLFVNVRERDCLIQVPLHSKIMPSKKKQNKKKKTQKKKQSKTKKQHLTWFVLIVNC